MGTLRGRPDLERPAFTTRDPLSDAHGMPLPSSWQKGAGATWAATPKSTQKKQAADKTMSTNSAQRREGGGRCVSESS